MFTTNPAKGASEPTGLLGVLHQPLNVQLLFSCSPQHETRGRKKERENERRRVRRRGT